jgi:hypothetical protein
VSAIAPVEAHSPSGAGSTAVAGHAGGDPVGAGSLPVAERAPSAFARPLLLVVRGYQLARAGRPSPCRFDPSCSAYAVDALRLHGAARGSYLAVRRLARCHPWGGQGYDPVPEKKAR